MSPVAVDFETFYCSKTKFSVKTLGTDAYFRDPRADVFLVAVYDGEQSWVGHPSQFDWSCLNGRELVSHNARFDRRAYWWCVSKGYAEEIRPDAWHCSANLTAFLCSGESSLEHAVTHLLRRAISKQARADMDGVPWDSVKDTDQGREFVAYADNDAKLCWEIWTKFSDQWPPMERFLSEMTISQCELGVALDIERVEEHLSATEKALWNATQKLPWISYASPDARNAPRDEAARLGIPPIPLKSKDKEGWDEWASEHVDVAPWIEWSACRAKLKYTRDLLRKLKNRHDDRIFRFDLRYFGAHTGRWSGSGGLNMQNPKRDDLVFDTEGRIIEVPESSTPENPGIGYPLIKSKTRKETIDLSVVPHVRVGIRDKLVARPGKKLYVCDLAQIEPRVLAYLAGVTWLLSEIRAGLSVYEANAVRRGIFNGDRGKFKEASKKLYTMVKAQVLSLGYSAGWETYIDAAWKMAQYDVCANDPISEVTGRPIYGYTARKEVAEYRRDHPEICGDNGLWRQLDDHVRANLNGSFTIPLPSGRELKYRNVRKEVTLKKVPVWDPNTGEVARWEVKQKVSYSALVGDSRKGVYGGLLTENYVQAVARDVLGWHLWQIGQHLPEVDILWSTHDEGIFEVDESFDCKPIHQIMSTTPPWLGDCPIAAEGKETQVYIK